MDEVLAATFREAAFERLNLLDQLANEGDHRAHAVLVETEILRLTAGWRALLAQHLPDDEGRCPQCSSRWRRRPGICTVWMTLHQCLFGDGDQDSETGRHVRRADRVRALLS